MPEGNEALPRWTQETEDRLLALLEEAVDQRATWLQFIRAVLNDLADHHQLMPPISNDRCTATTARGYQCTRWALPDSPWCWSHKRQQGKQTAAPV